jgi:ParB family chromosome partitioning protein
MKKNKGLGIGALLSTMNTNLESEDTKELVSQLSTTVNEIALSNIEANPYNPRVEFDEEGLQELSESIKIHGLIQPITVRHLGGERFQLISGERRLRASKMAGIETVPAYVRIAGDDAMLELALIENIQRQDLNAIEIANTYERLMDEMKITHETLAKRVGKKRSTVSNYLRLLKLPAVIQAAIKEEKITMGHAKALVNVENLSLVNVVCKEIIEQDLSVRKTEHYAKLFSKALPDLIQGLTSSVISLGHFEKISETPDIVIQLSVYKEVVRKRLSIPETENLISQFLNGSNNSEKIISKPEAKLTAAYQRVKDNLKSLLSTKVDLKVDKNGKGQIVINFQDVEDLNRIIETIDK